MSLKHFTPCDVIGPDGHYHCPYCEDGEYVNCEWYCGADEPEDNPEYWDEDGYDTRDYDEPENIDDDCGFDPYLGCFTDDC